MMLFILLLTFNSWASPVLDESSFNSRDLFDSVSGSISEESLDSNLYLNPLSSSQFESDSSLFEISEQTDNLLTFDDTGLLASVNDNCPLNNGQSRKRDGKTCPASGLVDFPSSSRTFGDYNEEELDPQGELDSEERNWNICSEILFFFGRIYDVCCNGGFGPFVIDPDVRLIYSWISDCRLGMFKLYVIALICVGMHMSDNKFNMQVILFLVQLKSMPAVGSFS